jgi:hypothetical protein
MPTPNIRASEPPPGNPNQPDPRIIDKVEPEGSLAETLASNKAQVDAGNVAK